MDAINGFKAKLCRLQGAFNAFATGNPFLGTNYLKLVLYREFFFGVSKGAKATVVGKGVKAYFKAATR